MKIAIVIAGLLFFSSCSWFSKSKPEVGDYAPTVVHSIEKPKPTMREIGSLWSDDSRWNDIYSPVQSRYPGELITVQLGVGLKHKIEQAAIAADPDRKPDKVVEKKEGEEQNAAAPAGAGGKAGQNDTKSVEATILEVLPRGTFRIAANKGVHVGVKDPYVVLHANVREQDIAGDQSVSSDALFNVQLEVINPEKVTNKKPVPEEQK